MIWIAPTEQDTENAALGKRLLGAAEQTVPGFHLPKTGYNAARPKGLLGLIFLRFAGVRFAARRAGPKHQNLRPHSSNQEKVRRLTELIERLVLPEGRGFPDGSVEVTILTEKE